MMEELKLKCRCVLWEEGMASIYKGEGERASLYMETIFHRHTAPGIGIFPLHHPIAKTGRKPAWKAPN